MPLLSLPLEVKEYILVLCAEAGFPTTIAGVAQTCRHFQELIYQPSDQHLWHQLFLTTFDDPAGLRFVDLENFDWGTAFRERVWASLYFARHAKSLSVGRRYSLRSRGPNVSLIDFPAPYHTESSTRALKILISVIQTSSPSPFRVAQPEQGPPSESARGTLGQISRTTPVFYHEHNKDTSNSSKNISWLQTLLANGYPPLLTVKLLSERVDPAWDDTEEAHAFYKLVACTGYLPIRTITVDGASAPAHPRGRSSTNPAATLSSLDLNEDAQRTRAWHLARTRTYNMKYLRRRRHWGPFLPLPARADNTDTDTDARPPSTSSQDLLQSDSDESDDSDFVPAEDDDADMEIDSGSPASASASPAPEPPRPRAPRLVPGPDELVPDWAWLASARIVVEANLREMRDMPEGLEALFALEGLREGAWCAQAPEDGAQDGASSGKGKGVRVDEDGDEWVEGWDWAGVEGVWRRCVCWFDYSDLIHFNYHAGLFDDQFLQEATLIVPCRLRIIGYSPSAVAGFEDRPTIHVVGEMGGAGWSDLWEDTRKLHGTVGVLADGSVRWCLYSSEDGSDEDQWVSEAIQVGGVGSGMGTLGMWTGATHESTDPLGPFWAWKVA